MCAAQHIPPLPPISPAHTGQCARRGPSTTQEEGPVQRARGLAATLMASTGQYGHCTAQNMASWEPVLFCGGRSEGRSQCWQRQHNMCADASSTETEAQGSEHCWGWAPGPAGAREQRRAICHARKPARWLESQQYFGGLRSQLAGPAVRMYHRRARAHTRTKRISMNCIERRR